MLFTRTTSIGVRDDLALAASGNSNVMSSNTEWKTSDRASATVSGPLTEDARSGSTTGSGESAQLAVA